MSRIRSIHPEQWTDEEFVTCSPLARLLAIGLRNEADDNGAFRWAALTMKMRILPADNCDVVQLLDELVATCQVIRYEADGRSYGLIRSFKRYQSPKKPTHKYPPPEDMSAQDLARFLGRPWSGEVQEGAESTPPVPHQYPTSTPPVGNRSEKVVVEGVGVGEGVKRNPSLRSGDEPQPETGPEPTPSAEIIPAKPAKPAPRPAKSKPSSRSPPSTDTQEARRATWRAYAAAYRDRYGTEPVQNAKANALIAQLVTRIGAEEAPQVAAWYLSHTDAWYLRMGHGLEQLVRDCEKLRMEWATGRQMTQTRAKQEDRRGTTGNLVAEIMAERSARG